MNSIIPRNVNKSNIPPLIPASTNFTTNYSNILQTEQVVVTDKLTDGTAILSGGTLTNLVNGSENQDAINKSYISGTSFPGGAIDNIQFNDGGVFGGTNALSWNPTGPSPTFTVSGKIQDSTGAFLSGGFASNLLVPINDQDIATKSYVDSFSNTTNSSSIALDTDTTYTAAQMFNGAIKRDTATSVFETTVNDTTATASQIIAYGNLGVGSVFRFILINDIIDPVLYVPPTVFNIASQFKINVLPGTGITFDIPNDPVLNRRYIMDCVAIVDNIGFGTESIRFIINSLADPAMLPTTFFVDPNITEGSIYAKPYVYSTKTEFPLKIQKNLLFPTSSAVNTDVPYTYDVADMKNSIIIRNPGADSADTLFDSTVNFQMGSTIFIIQNISSFTITLTPGVSWIGPVSTVIGPNLTAYLAIEQHVFGGDSDVMNFLVLGIFKHNNV